MRKHERHILLHSFFIFFHFSSEIWRANTFVNGTNNSSYANCLSKWYVYPKISNCIRSTQTPTILYWDSPIAKCTQNTFVSLTVFSNSILFTILQIGPEKKQFKWNIVIQSFAARNRCNFEFTIQWTGTLC